MKSSQLFLCYSSMERIGR